MAFVRPPECIACAELRKRVEELEKLTAHLKPRLRNDVAMRKEQRKMIAEGRYVPGLD